MERERAHTAIRRHTGEHTYTGGRQRDGDDDGGSGGTQHECATKRTIRSTIRRLSLCSAIHAAWYECAYTVVVVCAVGTYGYLLSIRIYGHIRGDDNGIGC